MVDLETRMNLYFKLKEELFNPDVYSAYDIEQYINFVGYIIDITLKRSVIKTYLLKKQTKCCYCKGPLNNTGEIAHLVAISSDCEWKEEYYNFLISCYECNKSIGNKTLKDLYNIKMLIFTNTLNNLTAPQQNKINNYKRVTTRVSHLIHHVEKNLKEVYNEVYKNDPQLVDNLNKILAIINPIENT